MLEARAVEDDEELVDVLSATMGELDDGHPKLFDETGEQLWWNGEEAEEPFDADTVRDLYLTEELVDADREGETQVLAGRIDDVGYLRISTWVGSGGVGTSTGRAMRRSASRPTSRWLPATATTRYSTKRCCSPDEARCDPLMVMGHSPLQKAGSGAPGDLSRSPKNSDKMPC